MGKVRCVGGDFGFGGMKLAEVVNGGDGRRMVTRVLPSVVGIGTTDEGGLTLAGVIRGRRGNVPHVVGFDGVEYLVGHGVAQYARPIERMDYARFTDGPELRALLYATLWELLDGGSHTVAMAMGLPVAMLENEAESRAIERAIRGWMIGEHAFTMDGQAARFEIVNVRAKIAQPVATWFEWGLNLEGQWCRGQDAAKAPVLVIDQGFNTLDLLVVEGGRISMRYTSGDTLGMRRAAELAIERIRRRYGVEMSLHEADDLVQGVVRGRKAEVYVVGELTNVTGEIRQALNSVGAGVVRFVERNVGAGRKFKILLTGGGALALADRLLHQYPHAEVMQEPVTANARGLAKLAARDGFLV